MPDNNTDDSLFDAVKQKKYERLRAMGAFQDDPDLAARAQKLVKLGVIRDVSGGSTYTAKPSAPTQTAPSPSTPSAYDTYAAKMAGGYTPKKTDLTSLATSDRSAQIQRDVRGTRVNPPRTLPQPARAPNPAEQTNGGYPAQNALQKHPVDPYYSKKDYESDQSPLGKFDSFLNQITNKDAFQTGYVDKNGHVAPAPPLPKSGPIRRIAPSAVAAVKGFGNHAVVPVMNKLGDQNLASDYLEGDNPIPYMSTTLPDWLKPNASSEFGKHLGDQYGIQLPTALAVTPATGLLMKGAGSAGGALATMAFPEVPGATVAGNVIGQGAGAVAGVLGLSPAMNKFGDYLNKQMYTPDQLTTINRMAQESGADRPARQVAEIASQLSVSKMTDFSALAGDRAAKIAIAKQVASGAAVGTSLWAISEAHRQLSAGEKVDPSKWDKTEGLIQGSLGSFAGGEARAIGKPGHAGESAAMGLIDRGTGAAVDTALANRYGGNKAGRDATYSALRTVRAKTEAPVRTAGVPFRSGQGSGLKPAPTSDGQEQTTAAQQQSGAHSNPYEIERDEATTPQKEANAVPSNTEAPYTRLIRNHGDLVRAFMDPASNFKYTPEQAHASATFFESIARSHAERYGGTVADFYSKFLPGATMRAEKLAQQYAAEFPNSKVDNSRAGVYPAGRFQPRSDADITTEHPQWAQIVSKALRDPTDLRRVLISFQSARQSTGIHEMAHVLRKSIINPEHLALLEDWAGVKNGKWTMEKEELFARSVERYIHEGHVPNKSLTGVFATIKEFMRQIYKTIGNIGTGNHQAFSPAMHDLMRQSFGDVSDMTGIKGEESGVNGELSNGAGGNGGDTGSGIDAAGVGERGHLRDTERRSDRGESEGPGTTGPGLGGTATARTAEETGILDPSGTGAARVSPTEASGGDRRSGSVSEGTHGKLTAEQSDYARRASPNEDWVPTGQLNYRPDIFQFRRTTTADFPSWSEREAGKNAVSVWVDHNGEIGDKGKEYIINGHHRFANAQKFGVPALRVRYIDAPTASAAREHAALENLLDSPRNDSLDVARFLRESDNAKQAGDPRKFLNSNGVNSQSSVVNEALSLTKLPKDVFDRVYADGGKTPGLKAVATAIGEHFSKPADMSRVFDASLKKMESGGKVTPDHIAEQSKIESAKAAADAQGGFGFDMGDTETRAEVVSGIKQHFNSLIRAGKSLTSKSAKTFFEATDKQGTLADRAKQVGELIDRTAHHSTPLGSKVSDAVKAIGAGGNRDEILQNLIRELEGGDIIVQSLKPGTNTTTGTTAGAIGGAEPVPVLRATAATPAPQPTAPAVKESPTETANVLTTEKPVAVQEKPESPAVTPSTTARDSGVKESGSYDSMTAQEKATYQLRHRYVGLRREASGHDTAESFINSLSKSYGPEVAQEMFKQLQAAHEEAKRTGKTPEGEDAREGIETVRGKIGSDWWDAGRFPDRKGYEQDIQNAPSRALKVADQMDAAGIDSSKVRELAAKYHDVLSNPKNKNRQDEVRTSFTDAVRTAIGASRMAKGRAAEARKVPDVPILDRVVGETTETVKPADKPVDRPIPEVVDDAMKRNPKVKDTPETRALLEKAVTMGRQRRQKAAAEYQKYELVSYNEKTGNAVIRSPREDARQEKAEYNVNIKTGKSTDPDSAQWLNGIKGAEGPNGKPLVRDGINTELRRAGFGVSDDTRVVSKHATIARKLVEDAGKVADEPDGDILWDTDDTLSDEDPFDSIPAAKPDASLGKTKPSAAATPPGSSIDIQGTPWRVVSSTGATGDAAMVTIKAPDGKTRQMQRAVFNSIVKQNAKASAGSGGAGDSVAPGFRELENKPRAARKMPADPTKILTTKTGVWKAVGLSGTGEAARVTIQNDQGVQRTITPTAWKTALSNQKGGNASDKPPLFGPGRQESLPRPPAPPLKTQLTDIKNRYATNPKAAVAGDVVKIGEGVNNLQRSVALSMDNGFVGRQGVMALLSNTILGRGKSANLPTIQNLVSTMHPTKGADNAEAMYQRIESDPDFAKFDEAGLHLREVAHRRGKNAAEARDEFYPSTIPDAIAERGGKIGQVVTAPLRGVERANVAFIDSLSFYTAKAMYTAAERAATSAIAKNPNAPKFDPAATRKLISEYVNSSTGHGRIIGDEPIFGSQEAAQAARRLQSFAFTSPRFWASRYQVWADAIPRLGDAASGKTYARREALKANLAYALVAGGAIGLAKLSGANVSLDPHDPNFLKIMFGGKNADGTQNLNGIDLSGGNAKHIRYMYMMAEAVAQGKSLADVTKIAAKYIRSNLGPTAGIISDDVAPQMAYDRFTDPVSKKLSNDHTRAKVTPQELNELRLRRIANSFAPIMAQDVMAIIKADQGSITPGGAGAAASQYLGFGTRGVPDRAPKSTGTSSTPSFQMPKPPTARGEMKKAMMAAGMR